MCAVLSSGSIQCWGSNSSGELGANSLADSSLVPLTVSNITTAQSVSAGYTGDCALLNDGSVQCWGANADDQLGNGGTAMSRVPVLVSGF